MSDHSSKREIGFSLLEMVIAMALGMIVLGAAVQLYSQGVAATWTVSQRAEMQQDFRAASNMLTRDLSLAGAGLGNNAVIALPSTTTPVYGCDQTGKCYINGAARKYPTQSGTAYLYGLIPGWDYGPVVNVAGGATDVVTVVYTDTSFYLNCYAATVSGASLVTFAPVVTTPATAWPPAGCLPNGVATPQAVNDTVAGLTAGDLVLMTLNGSPVVAEVTGAVTSTGTNTYSVPFANNDALKMNQTVSPYSLDSEPLNATGTAPTRILVITYYIDNTVTPPRLMRQVNGHTPMPLAENVVFMKFSYDLYNDTTGAPAVNQPNPGSGDANDAASNGLTPNQITKINILHMAMNSTLKGAQGGYQGLDLETSVSARDLTYNNQYPLSP